VTRAPALPEAFLAAPIAHRGLHDRAAGVIENSRAAARAAIAAGYAIECDVQASADGEALVFHDDVLERLTGHAGAISEARADVLTATPLAGAAEGETIPTLADFLALVAGRVPLLIEIKDQTHALRPEVGALERRVAELLAGYAGPVAVMSFNPHSIAAMAEAAPDVARGLTSCAFEDLEWAIDAPRRAHLAALADFDAFGCAFVSHDKADLANPAIGALKDRAIPVLTWTIRSAEEEALARGIADNITFESYRPPVDAAPAAPI
jgi:glycerophosphoryl diester phosphodiesterase